MLAGVLAVAAITVAGGLYLTRGGSADDPTGGGLSPSPTAAVTPALDAAGAADAPSGAMASGTASDVASGTASSGASTGASRGAGASAAQDQASRTQLAEAVPPRVTQAPPPEDATKVLPTAPPGPAVAGGREAANREFDAIKARLVDPEADAQAISREIPKLRALLPRYTTHTDSVWVYMQLIPVYGLVGDDLGTCSALRTAYRLATESKQLNGLAQLKLAFPNCL